MTGKWQFGLGAMMTGVTLLAVLLATIRLIPAIDLSAVDSTTWGGAAMVASVTVISLFGLRWFNS